MTSFIVCSSCGFHPEPSAILIPKICFSTPGATERFRIHVSNELYGELLSHTAHLAMMLAWIPYWSRVPRLEPVTPSMFLSAMEPWLALLARVARYRRPMSWPVSRTQKVYNQARRSKTGIIADARTAGNGFRNTMEEVKRGLSRRT
jgi:hypothetical protein